MPKKKKTLLLGLVFLLLLVLPSLVLADAGGGLDWDTDHWGGGGGMGGMFDGDFGSHGDGDFSFGMNPFFFFYFLRNPFLAILAIIVFIFLAQSKSRGKGEGKKGKRGVWTSSDPQSRAQQLSRNQNLQALLDRDPNFSTPGFLMRVGNVFVALQEAWTKKDWKTIRVFESNQLFAQHQRQLNQYIEKGQTNVVEDISILDSFIESYEEDKENSYLKAILVGRYRDYVVDDASGKVLKGNKDKRYIMTYRMQFMRSIKTKTQSSQETSVTQCPNCGASLSISQNGICAYCGSEVTTGANEWVLTSLQPIQQEQA